MFIENRLVVLAMSIHPLQISNVKQTHNTNKWRQSNPPPTPTIYFGYIVLVIVQWCQVKYRCPDHSAWEKLHCTSKPTQTSSMSATDDHWRHEHKHRFSVDIRDKYGLKTWTHIFWHDPLWSKCIQVYTDSVTVMNETTHYAFLILVYKGTRYGLWKWHATF